jgi:hypothetical protein
MVNRRGVYIDHHIVRFIDQQAPTSVFFLPDDHAFPLTIFVDNLTLEQSVGNYKLTSIAVWKLARDDELFELFSRHKMRIPLYKERTGWHGVLKEANIIFRVPERLHFKGHHRSVPLRKESTFRSGMFPDSDFGSDSLSAQLRENFYRAHIYILPLSGRLYY